MSWSLNIGTISGTAIRVHITFLLFLGWIFAANWASGGSQAACDPPETQLTAKIQPRNSRNVVCTRTAVPEMVPILSDQDM